VIFSPLLAAIPGLRHAFFTRDGGVSGGIYGGLNGGLGSNDHPEHVTENRRRMAEQMGVAPDRFLSVHQVHSPDAVVANGPWTVRRGRAPTPSSRGRKASPSASPRPIAGRSCWSTPTPA
jgi:hypothetical protein